MNDLTPAVIASDLRAALSRLDDSARMVRGVNAKKAEATVAYRKAKAEARLRSQARTVDLRDADVDLACYERMLAVRAAEADADAVITEAANLRALCMGLQSLLRQAQVELGLDNIRGAA